MGESGSRDLPSGNMQERKDYFKELQSHLRSRLQAIMDASRQLWETGVWEMEGSHKIAVNPLANRFVEEFLFKGSETKNSLEGQKRIIDWSFLLLIKDLDLVPRRFLMCEKCSILFYQATAKKRTYCSERCASAVRYARFEEKKRKEQKRG